MSMDAVKKRVEFQSLISGGSGQLHQLAKESKKPAVVDSYSSGDSSRGLRSIEKSAGYADVRTPMFRSPLARRG